MSHDKFQGKILRFRPGGLIIKMPCVNIHYHSSRKQSSEWDNKLQWIFTVLGVLVSYMIVLLIHTLKKKRNGFS